MAKNDKENNKKTFELRDASDSSEGMPVSKVAVFGLGLMGQGISQTISAQGITVRAFDRNQRALERGLEQLEHSMDREIERWGLTESEKRAILARIEQGKSIEEVEDCQLVIEAIIEDMDTKRNLLRELDYYSPKETIFISNTATMSLSEMAKATRREDKVIGMHFLNPVPKIPLVELVRGLRTSDETFKFVKEFAESIGKTPIEVFEYPGFVTTRLIAVLLNEAMHVFMEGVASAEGVDQAMKLGFNHPIGPLALADEMGLDEVLAWLEVLFRELGDLKYRPSPILRRMVRQGHLGVKTGRGFYEYTGPNGEEVKS